MSNLIFLLFFIISSTSSSSLNTTHKCSVQHTLALLHFKQNLSSINDNHYEYDYKCKDWLGSGYSPVMMNWNTSTDCCDWNGVTCDHSTGDVVGLDLSCGMVQGIIHPNTTLFHLPRLQKLNLAYNDFTDSQLPPDIGMLSSSLTHLNISNCGFTGQVPADISHLRKLVSLDLSLNGIDFNLEPHVFINLLQNLTVMKELSLEYVIISSVLPTNLNISSYLRLLNLQNTGLQGNLPHNIFNLQSLEKLDLSYNSFTGHIPSEISLLPKLVSLDLSLNGIDNLLIQPRIFNYLLKNSTFLTELWLAQVNIGSVLPTYLNISSPLRALDLSSTNLQGKLPDNILNLRYLGEVYMSENINLSGPLPKVNTSTPIPIWWLDLSKTSLSGEIPTSIGHLKSLEYLDLSDCRLNGSLPKSIGNLTNLVFLYLPSNKLSGTLPSSLFTLPSLEYIRLGHNMFQGNIPLELFSLQSLKGLSLTKNQLTGQIDVLDHGPLLQTFQRLTNLTYIDLSSNNFRGDWELDALLSSLTNLETLILSHSGISVTTSNANHYVNPNFGIISLVSCDLKVFPESFRAMKKVKHLDLSSNDIHGHIPDWIGEIGGDKLLVLDLSNNSITGTIPNVYENWSELKGFILNKNQLEGRVPTSLYKCQNLRIIDLGNNHLNDTFPVWLADLPKLQAIVLRSNNFHGDIVTSSTVKSPFSSLRVLDLSNNGFFGHLPTKYFQNFNAMKNVLKKDTEPEYVQVGRMYYSVIVAWKGTERDFERILVEFTVVDLSNNKFEGEIPNIIGNLNSLKMLNLSHNSLTGRIPQALGKISEIESLDLSWNQLIGEIPQSLSDLTSLGFLNLSQNHLVGRIPQGKQFNTFEGDSFGGNPKLCGLPLPQKCFEHPQQPQHEGDGDGEDEENEFTWKVVMIGYGCGTLLGIVLGFLMLSTGRPKWFNAIADAAEHIILMRKKQE
ncbi:putative leucine-rich repeat-containing, plant-type, leucine-rich repeat domain superfamily [Helianthus annuus]|uniref:Leucine-rich repeat-containing, plant-type, leucine-rich repeat domain superfamily n=1 Tax=Helianthus annuus TaxID=4232 RepID=A0A251SLI8_HELAN|nr:receptor-like protein 52 [Helianthus annuus]KAF5771089.1 putative leucine-rich repeat-containing, plant-type, leucine-rich repeat domain superfamily [Helianthus annuus]KAJ0842263.1 putative leucine-rich repeat-containing, plant-type, leucine-rich repeat domain superfamily [Helianthus annuus]KAJ0855876.1 putative leucine-rich repeat-containing, plant-type, leucine-rich repeat domain superfamily [Helianthus annuus]